MFSILSSPRLPIARFHEYRHQALNRGNRSTHLLTLAEHRSYEGDGKPHVETLEIFSHKTSRNLHHKRSRGDEQPLL